MSKAAVIFWSQTGNTEQMANAIADGIREGGMEVDVLNVADTTPADAVKYAKIALGCPAMGAEVLDVYKRQRQCCSVSLLSPSKRKSTAEYRLRCFIL